MKTIVLAAGQGSRLRPYTNERPKCMVSLAGKALLHHQLAVIQAAGFSPDDIALVGGYMKEKLDAPGLHLYANPHYASTNMVSTLFGAEDFMVNGEDLLICYGDIVYEPKVLQSVLKAEGELVLAADRDWKRLWSLRMDEPLSDAETFKVHDGQVVELGKKPNSYKDVEAQYIGLVRIRGDRVKAFREFYHALDRGATYDGQDFDNMYMTSFIQALIDASWDVRPAFINGGWLEVDTASELELYSAMLRDGTLESYINLDTGVL